MEAGRGQRNAGEATCFLEYIENMVAKTFIFNINQTTVSLEWSPPADNGGRNDVTYRILCKRCSWEQGECVPCGSNIGYMPQQTGLEDNYVTVMDLLAHANYTFEVEAVNGVSDLSRSQRLFACNHDHHPSAKFSHLPQLETLCPLNITSHPSHPPHSLDDPHSAFCLYDLNYFKSIIKSSLITG